MGATKSWLDKALGLFAEVRGGEGRQLLLLLVNIFAILFAYYMLKPVREGLLSGGFFGLSSTNTKIAVAGISSGLLFVVIPIYSKLVDSLSRLRLLNVSMGFVLVSLVVFYALGRSGVRVGAAFYLWLSIVNVFLVAQFWSYANDLYTEAAGKRLFAVIAIGMSAGAIAGSYASQAYTGEILWLLLGAGGILAFATLLYNITEWQSSQTDESDGDLEPNEALEEDTAEPAQPDASGGFSLIFRSRYLLLIAAMIMLTNIVNTTGEFILYSAAVATAETELPDAEFEGLSDVGGDKSPRAKATSKARGKAIKDFYGQFYFWVNLIGFLIQAFIVSRVFKFLGIRAALFILPIIALGGYAAIGLIGAVMVVRVAKTAENATDYSLQNTVKQALYLPTSRAEKYKAKAAIDTFFVRGGDLFAALISLGLGVGLGFGLKGYALVNVGFVVIWLVVTAAIAREHKKISQDTTAPAASIPTATVRRASDDD